MANHFRRIRSAQPPRRGVALVALMVFLAVGMMLILAWLKISALERRQLRAIQNRIQAEWLVESGIDRAAARLAADPGYQGETWQLSAADLGGQDAGEVVIRIEKIADESNDRDIVVQADYPANAQRRHRRTKTLHVSLSAPGGSS